MKSYLTLFLLFILLPIMAKAQQAICKPRVKVATSTLACVAEINPSTIDLGSYNYDNLQTTTNSLVPGEYNVGLIAIKGVFADTCYTIVEVYDATPPVLILKQDVVIDLGSSGQVDLSPSMLEDGSYDQCSGVEFVLVPARLDCGSKSPVEVQIFAYDAEGNYQKSVIEVEVTNKINASVTMVCNALVEVNVGSMGTVEITPDDVLEGGPYKCPSHYSLVLSEGGIPRSNDFVSSADVGKTFLAIISEPINGNTCWGNVVVRLSPCAQQNFCDNLASCTPAGDCASGHSLDDYIEWPCTIQTQATPLLLEHPSPEVLMQVLNLPEGHVKAISKENECSMIQTTYNDQIFYESDHIKIRRIWYALNWLNNNTAFYVQDIYLNHEDVNLCFICDTLPWNTPVSGCIGGHTDSDAIEWPADFSTNSRFIAPDDLRLNPEVDPRNVRPQILDECNNFVTAYSDLFHEVNDTMNIITRTWDVFDYDADSLHSYTQIITVNGALDISQRTVCITTMTGKAVPEVQIQQNVYTSESACVSFAFDESQNTVRPKKNGNAADGIDIDDAILLSDFILGIRPLNEWQKLAADVNLDGIISSFDLVTMIKLITGDLDTLPKTWRFFYQDNARQYPQNADITNPYQSYHFIAIKTGDLDDSQEGSVSSSYVQAKLNVDDESLNAGEWYSSLMRADRNFNAVGLQMAIQKKANVEILPSLADYLMRNGSIAEKHTEDKILFTWIADEKYLKNGGLPITKGQELVKIKLLSSKNTILSDVLKLDTEFISKLRSFENEPNYVLNLNFEGKIISSTHEIDSNSNVKIFPNPASSRVNIISESSIIHCEAYSTNGHLVFSMKNPDNYIDVINWLNGVYYFKLTDVMGNVSIKKLTVMH